MLGVLVFSATKMCFIPLTYTVNNHNNACGKEKTTRRSKVHHKLLFHKVNTWLLHTIMEKKQTKKKQVIANNL